MQGGVTSLIVTSSGGYRVLARNWLLLGYNPSGTLGIFPSELPRNREGTRANEWTDDCRQYGRRDGPEDRDIYVKIQNKYTIGYTSNDSRCNTSIISML